MVPPHCVMIGWTVSFKSASFNGMEKLSEIRDCIVFSVLLFCDYWRIKFYKFDSDCKPAQAGAPLGAPKPRMSGHTPDGSTEAKCGSQYLECNCNADNSILNRVLISKKTCCWHLMY